MEDLNKYIKKSHFKAVEKFNKELEDFRKETGDEVATLYENIYTSFKLSDIRIVNGELVYNYDGKEDKESVVIYDDESDSWYEDDLYGIMDILKFWKSCLRRAKKYWSMNPDTLDAISEGFKEDIEIDEE